MSPPGDKNIDATILGRLASGSSCRIKDKFLEISSVYFCIFANITSAVRSNIIVLNRIVSFGNKYFRFLIAQTFVLYLFSYFF